ncbi:hypothetical protein EDC01DRAFT_792128 [Geopyxis carbonaria]|nr:hypothetical protein EDC01DRAFT_792128 [Geopyxis carbonaria]
MSTIKQAAWTHGVDVQLEDKTWSALRQGFGTQVRPASGATSGWVHFAVPTPVLVDGARLKAGAGMARFLTGANAQIIGFHVYDGEKRILARDGLSYKGALQMVREVLPNNPEVLWGTEISLCVQFQGNGAEAYVNFVSAGIDFYS